MSAKPAAPAGEPTAQQRQAMNTLRDALNDVQRALQLCAAAELTAMVVVAGVTDGNGIGFKLVDGGA